MKKIVIFLPLLITAFLLAGCEDSYGPLYFRQGYSETVLNDSMYSVSYTSDNFTSARTDHNYVLRRCAELTLMRGYKYFIILGSAHQVNQYSPDATMKMLKSNKGFPQAYDAKVVLSNFKRR